MFIYRERLSKGIDMAQIRPDFFLPYSGTSAPIRRDCEEIVTGTCGASNGPGMACSLFIG
jgi:hypothetical protein